MFEAIKKMFSPKKKELSDKEKVIFDIVDRVAERSKLDQEFKAVPGLTKHETISRASRQSKEIFQQVLREMERNKERK